MTQHVLGVLALLGLQRKRAVGDLQFRGALCNPAFQRLVGGAQCGLLEHPFRRGDIDEGDHNALDRFVEGPVGAHLHEEARFGSLSPTSLPLDDLQPAEHARDVGRQHCIVQPTGNLGDGSANIALAVPDGTIP